MHFQSEHRWNKSQVDPREGGRENKRRAGLELVGRVGLGVEAGESRGKNGEQNNMGADICPEMQVECGGGEQVIWKMRLTHTQKLGPESRLKANMGETNQMGWEETAGSD